MSHNKNDGSIVKMSSPIIRKKLISVVEVCIRDISQWIILERKTKQKEKYQTI